jgi:crotonobetainyl-CoA:carnitine CoA-transferase CaiB-like acyl-CoA transferase
MLSQLHGVIERQADNRLAVDGGEEVARLDAGARGGRAVHRRDDLDRAVLGLDYEAQPAVLAAGLVAQSATGTAPSRSGSHRPTSAWSGCVRCAGPDDWIAIDIEDPALLTQRLHTAGIAHESSDQTPAAAIARWAAERDSGSASRLLQQAGITAGPVTPASALLEDPHLKATGFWLRADRRHVGSHWLPRAPYAINAMAPPLKWPAPTLGEHNQVVLASVLGMSDSEIEALQDQGIIGTVPTV